MNKNLDNFAEWPEKDKKDFWNKKKKEKEDQDKRNANFEDVNIGLLDNDGW